MTQPAADDDWQNRAACAQPGIDPEIFFATDPCISGIAKNVCVACPVRQQCLIAALRDDENDGIRGGFTPAERRRIKNGRPAPKLRPNCGTAAGYDAHRNAKEPTCQPCKDARAEYQRDRRTQLQPPVSRTRCGTYAGYSAHRREDEKPCDACRQAQKKYRRDHKTRYKTMTG